MFPDLIVGGATQVTELLEHGRGLVSMIDDIRHVSSQDKGSSVPKGRNKKGTNNGAFKES